MIRVPYLVLDIETTGLNVAQDEILQLAIVDERGDTLFNRYFKPRHHATWPQAEKVHHISPDDVAHEAGFAQFVAEIQAVIDRHDAIVAYNADFDLGFLRAQGIIFDRKKAICVMRAFAPLYGKRRRRGSGYIWQSLETCARFFNIKNLDAHDALGDARATLECYRALQERLL
jgi:DNA polymerase III epsilon subunit-like protein